MIILSENKINSLRLCKCTVYTNCPIHDKCECFANPKNISGDVYESVVSIKNLKYEDGTFSYTSNDMSIYDDWFGKTVLPIIGKFVISNDKSVKIWNTTDFIKDKKNKDVLSISKLIKSHTCTEDLSIYEYKFYLTLFNDYNIKELQTDRQRFYDLKLTSSRYDLQNKLQNIGFLKSKDFTMINNLRKTNEHVKIGIVIQSKKPDEYTVEYGTVYIDMNNKLSIIWN